MKTREELEAKLEEYSKDVEKFEAEKASFSPIQQLENQIDYLLVKKNLIFYKGVVLGLKIALGKSEL